MSDGLLDLPSELQSAIISWLLRKADLISLCLVSKQLYHVTMPILYHSVSLNVDHWQKRNMDRFLTHGHQGHLYIRSLDIDSDKRVLEVVARKAAKDALTILPRDCLRSFRYVK